MYRLKVNYWKNMGDPDRGILINAGDEIEAMPVTVQQLTNPMLMYKIRPLGAQEWCSELVHADNIEITDTNYYTMPKSELFAMLASAALIMCVLLYVGWKVIE